MRVGVIARPRFLAVSVIALLLAAAWPSLRAAADDIEGTFSVTVGSDTWVGDYEYETNGSENCQTTITLSPGQSGYLYNGGSSQTEVGVRPPGGCCTAGTGITINPGKRRKIRLGSGSSGSATFTTE